MKLLGITGGVGMGKSTAGAILEKKGVPVVDTDQIARQLVEPGQPALQEISAAFGPSILQPDGAVNRKELARRVFADPGERAKLEAILHPKIRAAWQTVVEQWKAAGHPRGAVTIPLLYEIKAESYFNPVICVACSAASQFERLRERGWGGAEIRKRIDAQYPVEEKIARANFVIWTDTTLEAHTWQWERLLVMI